MSKLLILARILWLPVLWRAAVHVWLLLSGHHVWLTAHWLAAHRCHWLATHRHAAHWHWLAAHRRHASHWHWLAAHRHWLTVLSWHWLATHWHWLTVLSWHRLSAHRWSSHCHWCLAHGHRLSITTHHFHLPRRLLICILGRICIIRSIVYIRLLV